MLQSESQEPEGVIFAKKLTEMLEVGAGDLISEAYVDMLRRKEIQQKNGQ